MNTSRGFTLIETLVYIALFALIIGGFVAASYMLFETSDRNQTKAMMQQEGNFLIAKVKWSLSGALLVSAPAANTSGATLSLVRSDGSVAVFALASTTMMLNGNALNNTNTVMSKLVFIHASAGSTNPESVETGFTITATTPNGMTVSESASTTSYLRK